MGHSLLNTTTCECLDCSILISHFILLISTQNHPVITSTSGGNNSLTSAAATTSLAQPTWAHFELAYKNSAATWHCGRGKCDSCLRHVQLTWLLLASKGTISMHILGPQERGRQQVHIRRHSSAKRHWWRAWPPTLRHVHSLPPFFPPRFQHSDGTKLSIQLIFNGYVSAVAPTFCTLTDRFTGTVYHEEIPLPSEGDKGKDCGRKGKRDICTDSGM